LLIFAEILRTIAVVVLIISSAFYFRRLAKTKKQGEISIFEYIMYIMIQIAFAFFAISLLIFVFVGDS